MGSDRTAVPAYVAMGVGIPTGAVGLLGAIVALGWNSSAGGAGDFGTGIAGGVGLFLLGVALGVSLLGVGLAALGAMGVRRDWVRTPAVGTSHSSSPSSVS